MSDGDVVETTHERLVLRFPLSWVGQNVCRPDGTKVEAVSAHNMHLCIEADCALQEVEQTFNNFKRISAIERTRRVFLEVPD